MADPASFVLQALEKKIGVSPGNYPSEVASRSDLCAWLAAQGIPAYGPSSYSRASDHTIRKAYANASYLKGWLKNVRLSPRRIESSSDLDELDLDIPKYGKDCPQCHYPMRQTMKFSDEVCLNPACTDCGISTENKPNGRADSESSSSITATQDAIAKAAEFVLSQKIEQFKREMRAMTEACAEAKMSEQFAKGEQALNDRIRNTKLELSDAAKQSIRDLATSSARALIQELMPPRRLEIDLRTDSDSHTTVDLGLQHEKFALLLKAIGARNHQGWHLNIWLTGPTGSGKTTAAENAAQVLASTFKNYRKLENEEGYELIDKNGNRIDLGGTVLEAKPNADGTYEVVSYAGIVPLTPFGADSSLDADYKVIGFKDANGRFHWTTFLRIFAFGGIYVADEIDNWYPSALVAINAALANGWISTPIGLIRRHKDCCIIAAANTWGLGATNDYVGRTKLDAATINRFPTKIDWPIDERLERAVAQEMGGELGSDWCDLVQTTRKKAKGHGTQIIISPRNTFDGIALLLQGFDKRQVIEMNLSAGLKDEQIKALGLDSPVLPNYASSDVGPDIGWKRFTDAIRNNRKIEAIKLWRDRYGISLYGAKNEVENIISGLKSIPTNLEWLREGP